MIRTGVQKRMLILAQRHRVKTKRISTWRMQIGTVPRIVVGASRCDSRSVLNCAKKYDSAAARAAWAKHDVWL